MFAALHLYNQKTKQWQQISENYKLKSQNFIIHHQANYKHAS